MCIRDRRFYSGLLRSYQDTLSKLSTLLMLQQKMFQLNCPFPVTYLHQNQQEMCIRDRYTRSALPETVLFFQSKMLSYSLVYEFIESVNLIYSPTVIRPTVIPLFLLKNIYYSSGLPILQDLLSFTTANTEIQ